MQQALPASFDVAARLQKTAVEALPARSPRLGADTDGLARAIDRLDEVVAQETAALRSRVRVDLKDFNIRKSHGLLELTRAMRQLGGAGPDEVLRGRLEELRANLELNRAAIAMHLEAVREVSEIMAEAMQQAESDGTYSEAAGRTGPRP